MTTTATKPDRVSTDVAAEMARQNEKWGEQNHPDGTGPDTKPLADYEHRKAFQTGRPIKLSTAPAEVLAACATEVTDVAAKQGQLTWADILTEEHLEALAESDPDKLRTELIQVAAVAQQWAAAIDRRGAALHAVTLTADDMSVQWDAEHLFPFFEDENAYGLWGHGHQDAATFAESVNDYDQLVDPKGWDSAYRYTADDVHHGWAIAYLRGPSEEDWIVSYRIARTERDLTHGTTDLERVTEDAPGAFPVTHIHRQ